MRFTRFFNNTPMAIASVDGEGRILRTNAPFMKLFADVISRDEIDQHGLIEWYGQFAGHPPLALVHGEDKAREALAGEIGERDGIEVVLARPGMALQA